MPSISRRPLVLALVAPILATMLVGCGASTGGRLSDDVKVRAADTASATQPADPLARRLKSDPVAVLNDGLAWYEKNVKNYTCTLYKLERLDPKADDFLDEQKIEVKFKEDPYSVYTHAVENARGANKAVFVEDKWGGKMKARTGGFLPLTVTVDPTGSLAMQHTLRAINQFGFKRNLLNIREAIKTSRAEGTNRLKVLGDAKVGEREVIVFESWVEEPTPSGRFDFPHIKVYLDRQWLLPLGVDLFDANGIERARYRMTDIKFNVGLTDEDFTLKALGM